MHTVCIIMTSRGAGSEDKEDNRNIDGQSGEGNEGLMDCCRWIKSVGQILPLQRSNQVIIVHAGNRHITQRIY